MKPVEIEMVSDFICPWCWIGHRNLKAGVRQAGLDEAAIRMRFAPFELNPEMPAEGLDRRDYRTRKFGSWARSQVLDAQVVEAGKRAGVTFNYDRVEVTPNTRLAHRLMGWAQSQNEPAHTAGLFEAIFAAYFSQGQNIGEAAVLVSLAARQGFNADAARAFLQTRDGEREVVAAELQAAAAGVQSVPTIRMAGAQVSGAQPPALMASALMAAAAAVAEAA
jgi:predicted DsbA family dithiol-disulfide isomerase